MAGKLFVYQVINFDEEEMFFGTSDQELEKEIERIAKDPSGPAKAWKQGQLVQWRALTDELPEAQAKSLHKDLEARQPPNKFRVISTV